MGAFRNILVICDEESSCEHAFDRVCGLGQRDGARVTLADVIDGSPGDLSGLLRRLAGAEGTGDGIAEACPGRAGLRPAGAAARRGGGRGAVACRGQCGDCRRRRPLGGLAPDLSLSGARGFSANRRFGGSLARREVQQNAAPAKFHRTHSRN
ncbi:universal stress protein [Mangrovicoccus ximenensis]|uniref:universal stress protein n=1 Tax=Mangrovicoccus ximenensis TaxID=1911570 RepID=UPI001374A60C|nr:universal stress protein [Mangrovicoccus ximenensis]